MLTIEQVRERIKPYNLRAVAKDTGINYPTLWRAVRKPDLPAKYEVVKTLSDYLSKSL
jgi:predicted DNA-binding transcriptional regulator AlpA